MNETVVAPTTAAAPVVTIGANFSGPNFHTDPGIVVTPPDTDGAAGPTSFVELLNNFIRCTTSLERRCRPCGYRNFGRTRA